MATLPLEPAAKADLGQQISEWIGYITGLLYDWILVFLLIAVGIFLTIKLRAVQFRRIKAVFRSLAGSRHTPKGEISSFQAFAVGLGTRVGIGNIVGVALALIVGGPGAIFWMWLVALIGMATAFSESTLAQIFKVRAQDGTFRGGPAYYMERGMRAKSMGKIFAVVAIISSGISVPMVQINAVAGVFGQFEFQGEKIPAWIIGLVIAALVAPVILGGLRSVARAAEYLTPIMAGIYLLITLIVIFSNLPAAGQAFVDIFTYAFGVKAAVGGVGGAIFVALTTGVRRGLFSNEAGLGTAPNTAGTAAVAHPVSQGMLQALGVFIDTIVVCTATALLILIAGPDVYQYGVTEPDAAAVLTSNALMNTLGPWMALPMAVIIFIFGYTSAFGAYSYGQINMDNLTENKWASLGFRVFVVFAVWASTMISLTTVWALGDLLLGLGGVINLVALIALGKWVAGALRDWEKQKDSGVKVPVFVGKNNPELPGDVPGDVWANAEEVAKTAGVPDLSMIRPVVADPEKK